MSMRFSAASELSIQQIKNSGSHLGEFNVDDSHFSQLVSEITKRFADVSKENTILKEELQKFRQGEARTETVEFDACELPRPSSVHDDEDEDQDPVQSQSYQGLMALKRCQSGIEETDFFPEWPLNIHMQGRSAEVRTSLINSTILMRPLQVPLPHNNASSANFVHEPCLISPNSYFRITWDFFSCAILLVQVWLTLFMLAFTPETGAPAYFSYFDDCIALFFVTDMILNFNTGIIRQVDDYDWIIMNRRAIAKDYCSFFFWVDLVSTIPFDRLLQNEKSNLFYMVRIMRIARWLKLLRFLRLTRLLKMFRSISKSFELEIERLKKKLFFPLVAVAITALLAHINTCMLQALSPREVLPNNMYDIYFQRLSHVLFALIAGRYIEAYEEPLLLLDLSMAMERLTMLAVAGFMLVYQVMLHLEQTVKNELIKKDVLLYMEQRQVSHKTQVHVLNQLKEANKLASVKQNYDTWIASGIPLELERRIAQELWLPRLKTLGLIEHVLYLKPALKYELILIVREEAYPKHSILFKEGVLPLSAYLVLKGVIRATSSMSRTLLPLFTADMWVGEKALVSPDMARTVSCVCQTTCSLMAVPAQSFRKLLMEYGVLGQFEEYCVQNLWRGICGCCGVVGDHFAHECPLNCIPDTYTSLAEEEKHLQADADDDVSFMDPGRALLSEHAMEVPVPREHLTKPDLREFLRCHNLKYLSPILDVSGIWSLSDLQELSPATLNKLIADAADVRPGVDQDLLRRELSAQFIDAFKDGLEDQARKVLGTSELRSQHLIFLSHHKLDSGTEAALLRQELEVQIQEDLRLRIMDAPVFLDTEDLNSLQKLQEHVASTHYIVLLLSEDVLSRPWVLVELVTAHRVDLPVVPVEIRKPGQQFKYPDETFYDELLRGRTLAPAGRAILNSCGISLKEVEMAIRRTVSTISLSYSPHRPALHRKVEVADILKHCDYDPTVNHRRKALARARLSRASQGRRIRFSNTTSS